MSGLSYTKNNEKFCLETERVSLLLKKAKSPDKNFLIIHVCGTNGKGSVCSFLETGFISMGINCGRFSSPELFSVEDSITVCGKAIDERDLQRISTSLIPLCAEVEKELGKAPSPFEIIFASALLYFKEKNCTHVILECGMGGKGDATNAIEGADVAVFTDISMDHTEYLGCTIEEITFNKCGILREGIKVFSSEQTKEALGVIKKECKKYNCSLKLVSSYNITGREKLNSIIDTGTKKLTLSLAGDHQAKNASLAIEVLKEFGIDEGSILHTLTHSGNRARMEEIHPNVYFDGAHNPAGVKSLVNTINSADIGGKIIFVNGFMADKDIVSSYKLLNELNNKNFEIYTCTVESNPRSESSQKLTELAKNMGYSAKGFNNVREAVKKARENADVIFVFGSLYMYKELINKNGEVKCE